MTPKPLPQHYAMHLDGELPIEAVAAAMETDGYIVLATNLDLRVGDALAHERLPLRVVGVATHEDSLRQLRLASSILGLSPEGHLHFRHYYRTIVPD